MDLEVPGATAGSGREQDRVLEVCDALRAGAVCERGLSVADPPLEVGSPSAPAAVRLYVERVMTGFPSTRSDQEPPFWRVVASAPNVAVDPQPIYWQ